MSAALQARIIEHKLSFDLIRNFLDEILSPGASFANLVERTTINVIRKAGEALRDLF